MVVGGGVGVGVDGGGGGDGGGAGTSTPSREKVIDEQIKRSSKSCSNIEILLQQSNIFAKKGNSLNVNFFSFQVTGCLYRRQVCLNCAGITQTRG